MGADLSDELFDDVEGQDRDNREALIRWLLDHGLTQDEILEAKQQDRLAMLPTERVLSTGCTLSLAEASERSGLRRSFIERVWRVAGIPLPEGDEGVIDAEDDLEAMRVAKLALSAGMPEDAYVEISRVVGRAAEAIAQAMVQETSEVFLSSGENERAYAMRLEEFTETVMPVMPALVAFPIRMHLRNTLRNQAVERNEGEIQGIKGTRRMAIGFADLVGFSSLSEEVELSESSRVAGKLEELATAVAEPPVRLVKLIGDEAMLVSESTAPLIASLVDLQKSASAEHDFPSLHIGVAAGEVVLRAGDVYGPAVNKASRLTSASGEGQFLVSPEVAEEVRGRFELREMEPIEVKGIGEISPHELRIAPGE